MISQTVEYALRAVVALAYCHDTPMTGQEIAEMTRVPAPYLLKAATGLCFLVPFWVLRNLMLLFPRRAVVDSTILTVAVQLAAALDAHVTVHQLRSVLPPNLSDKVLEEALLLLQWSGLVETVRGDSLTVLATDRHRNLALSGSFGTGEIQRLSDLMA